MRNPVIDQMLSAMQELFPENADFLRTLDKTLQSVEVVAKCVSQYEIDHPSKRDVLQRFPLQLLRSELCSQFAEDRILQLHCKEILDRLVRGDEMDPLRLVSTAEVFVMAKKLAEALSPESKPFKLVDVLSLRFTDAGFGLDSSNSDDLQRILGSEMSECFVEVRDQLIKAKTTSVELIS